MNIGATNSAVQLGQLLQDTQKSQMEFAEKLIKTTMTAALSVNPAVGALLDTVA